MKHVKKGAIYKAKRGCIYDTSDSTTRKFNHFMVCMTGWFKIVDCFPCTKHGDIHPGYSCCGVPVYTDNFENEEVKI